MLFNPAICAKDGIKWGLIGHTVATFAFDTISIAARLAVQSNSYINNREFPGIAQYPPGPFAFQFPGLQGRTMTIALAMFPLNQSLTDGLLVSSLVELHLLIND